MKFVLTGKYLEVADIRGGQPHTGIDIAMPENTVLRAIKDGYVERILHNDKIGNGLIIKDQEGHSYIYGHLNKIEVKGPGQHIYKGQEIGLSGNTGHSTGAHLHFGETDAQGHFIDPTHLGQEVANMSGSHPNWFVDKWNQAGDYIIGKENDMLLQPFLAMIKELGREFWQWFILNLPDIMGYTAMAAGVMIILSAMMGKGILKPIGWFTGAFIFAACILGGVKG